MHHYVVQQGDTPHSIARRHGIHVWQLIQANPNKPVVTVSGQQTWSALSPGERLRIPHRSGGFVAPPPPPAQQPWWQQNQNWQPGNWQPQMQARQQLLPPPPPQPWWQQQQIPPPPRPYNPGRFRFGPLHGVGHQDASRLLAHQEEMRRLVWGRHGYEYGDNPYGVADGALGDAASDAVNALLSAGDPCDPNNVGLVCAAQAALGVGVDGKWGAGTATRAQALVPGAPGACTPRPAWWAPAGQSNCGAASPLQMPPLVVTPPSPLPPPPAPPPSAPPPVVPATVAPASSAPLAVQAMAGLDPCAAANVNAVCAAQAALGVGVDGKWGTGTAARAAAVFPGAPPACSPRPSWWAPAGQSNCAGAPPRPARPPLGGGGAPMGPPGTAPTPSSPLLQSSMVPGGISVPKGGSGTMAVAGVLGVVALAGIVAVVATGSHEQIVTRYRTRRTPAPAPAPAPAHHRAPAPHRRAPARRLTRRPKRK
jgi:LysM domain